MLGYEGFAILIFERCSLRRDVDNRICKISLSGNASCCGRKSIFERARGVTLASREGRNVWRFASSRRLRILNDFNRGHVGKCNLGGGELKTMEIYTFFPIVHYPRQRACSTSKKTRSICYRLFIACLFETARAGGLSYTLKTSQFPLNGGSLRNGLTDTESGKPLARLARDRNHYRAGLISWRLHPRLDVHGPSYTSTE